MSSLCGWCGFNLGGKTPQQTMNTMLEGCRTPSGSMTKSAYDNATGLATSSGQYVSSFKEQDGIKVALVLVKNNLLVIAEPYER